MAMSRAQLEAIQDTHANWLLRQPGVQGVHVEQDETGSASLVVLGFRISTDVKDLIRHRLRAPVKFVEIEIKPYSV